VHWRQFLYVEFFLEFDKYITPSGGFMKVLRLALISILALDFCMSLGNAQDASSTESVPVEARKSSGSIPVGFGATFIDGETYYLINLLPEVSFGQLGVGLDLNLRFTTKGKLRSGDFDKFEDYLRIIRYVRWAQKGDPFYIRLGQLDYSLLGHGSIIYNYRNSASYDLRRTGIELDLNFEKYGLESVYSDLAYGGILGFRGYVKPLKFTSLAKIPAINNFEIGMTFARDLSKQADITAVDSSGRGLSIVGFDFGLPVISYAKFKTTLYFDYAKIYHYGQGSAVGINMLFRGLGLLDIRGKYELRFNGDNYLPSYFNAFYEYDRYTILKKRSKSDTLRFVKANSGYFGELVFSVLNSLNIIAGYQAPFAVANEGVLHAELQLPELSGIVLRGAYDKARIGKIFILDNYSILSAEIGYKPVPFLMVSTLYQRTYSNRNPNGTLRPDGSFVAQDRVEPKVSLVIEF
jgi:hypothetical protein